VLDWQKIFVSGKNFDDWISSGESEENREKIREAVGKLPMPPKVQKCLKNLSRPVHVVAIAEDWCGDVVRHVPVLEKIDRASDRVRVRYISREQHPDAFCRFLTNGGEAIPKFVFLSEDFVEVGNWGPMPSEEKEWIARGKACNDVGAAREKVAEMYRADPQLVKVFSELCRFLKIAATESIE
jgi:hypothetical protein